jgi:hypothetical protein
MVRNRHHIRGPVEYPAILLKTGASQPRSIWCDQANTNIGGDAGKAEEVNFVPALGAPWK